MAKAIMGGNFSVVETAALVKNLSGQLGSSVTLADEIFHMQGQAGMHLMVFEKYYMRSGSYTSLTVAVTGDSQSCYVDIIGAGGGEGLFNLSWGSEADFVAGMIDLLKAHGFEEIE